MINPRTLKRRKLRQGRETGLAKVVKYMFSPKPLHIARLERPLLAVAKHSHPQPKPLSENTTSRGCYEGRCLLIGFSGSLTIVVVWATLCG